MLLVALENHRSSGIPKQKQGSHIRWPNRSCQDDWTSDSTTRHHKTRGTFSKRYFFSKTHAARCGRVFGASSLRRSWKMWLRGELWNGQHEEYEGQSKIATDVFLECKLFRFFCCCGMCRSLLSALIQLMWSRCHIYGKSQSLVLRPELRQIVCPTTVVREESFTSCRLGCTSFLLPCWTMLDYPSLQDMGLWQIFRVVFEDDMSECQPLVEADDDGMIFMHQHGK